LNPSVWLFTHSLSRNLWFFFPGR